MVLEPGVTQAPDEAKRAFPEMLRPLFEPHRYKVMYGGRGGAKSWGVARALLIKGAKAPLRILCTREIQKNITESVHQLLKDQITAMGLEDFYTVTDNKIVGVNGTLFSFAGLRSLDANKLKSYEGYDIVWCEEAQVITKKSWQVLIPTIRKPNSEIWITFNPELETDETYERFITNTPPDTWKCKINWRDNPWFPKVLEAERQYCKLHDPTNYDWIWEGICKPAVEGAIYAGEIATMMQNQQLRLMPYDPALKVHTIWDLGWADAMVVGFVQRLHSEVRLIHYIEDNRRSLADFAGEINRLPYVYGKHWLPHDGANKSHQTGKSSQQILKGLGMKAVVIPVMPVETGISAVRLLLPRLFIDTRDLTKPGETGFRGGARLIDCLKRYRRRIPVSTDEASTPLHDEYSHGADMIRMLALVVDRINNDDDFRTNMKVRRHRISDPGIGL